MDIARWGLNRLEHPLSVVSTGGKYVYDDDQETPNTQLVQFDYGNGAELTFEVRGLLTDQAGALPMDGRNCIGNRFYGADGYLVVDDDGFQVYKGEKREKVMDEKLERGKSTTGLHMDNFLQAVKSRKHKDLTADVEIGVISANLCHLANISYRLKRRLVFDPKTWKFTGDAEANKMLTREYRKPYAVPENV